MEEELSKLRAEKIYWDAERLRAKREYETLEDKLNDAARDLTVSKYTQMKAVKRYDKAMAYNRDVEGELDDLKSKFDAERGEMIGKLRDLKAENAILDDYMDRLIQKEDELEDLRSNNNDLEKELGFQSREKDAQIKDLIKKCVELEAAVRDKDERIVELNRRNEELKARKDRDSDEQAKRIEVLCSQIMEIASKKNGKKEKAGLERENHQRYWISDRDDEDEDVFCHVNDGKRARASSPTNTKCKIKKREHVISESPTHGRAIVSSGRNYEVDIFKYLSKGKQVEGNYVFEGESDMIRACKNNQVLFAKAVSALGRSGLLCSGRGGFKNCDFDRAINIIYCDPNSDTEALDICQKLVREYSRELFQMFKSNDDPLFSHLSTSINISRL